MNKYIYLTALIIVCACCTNYAQPLILLGIDRDSYQIKDKNNSLNRHVTHLNDKRDRMEIRLNSLEEYQYIKNLDSIVAHFLKEISFYKDSLSNLGSNNIRISYISYYDNTSPRILFSKHQSKTKYFVKKGNEIAALKIKQDTIKITLVSPIIDSLDYPIFWRRQYTLQHIYFYLNNYSDLENYTKQGLLQQYADTMMVAAKSKKNKKKYKKPISYSTVFYKPYITSDQRLLAYNSQISGENVYDFYVKGNYFDKVSFNGNIGVGLIRNKLAPMGVLGLEYRNYWVEGEKECSIFGIYASPYFLFEQDINKQYSTYTSWFVNAELGTTSVKGFLELLDMKRFTIGAGYLLNPNGVHFKNTTIKAFSNITLSKGITISPEIIATNTFKNIFPGVTVKVF